MTVHEINILQVHCESCEAKPNEMCVTKKGTTAQVPHRPRVRLAEKIQAEEKVEQENHGTEDTGFACKKCNGPAPMGVGYAVWGDGAAQDSENITECECGYSKIDLPWTGIKKTVIPTAIPGKEKLAPRPNRTKRRAYKKGKKAVKPASVLIEMMGSGFRENRRRATRPAGAPRN